MVGYSEPPLNRPGGGQYGRPAVNNTRGVEGGTRRDPNTGRVSWAAGVGGSRIDVAAITSVLGVQGTQTPLPALGLRPTWRTATQQGYELTLQGGRGGLEMQRGPLEQAHDRVARGDLLVHSSTDDMSLAFKLNTQQDLQAVFPYSSLVHTRFQNNVIMAPYLSGVGIGASSGLLQTMLLRETSSTDPTVVLLMDLHANANLFSLATAYVQGEEYLFVLTSAAAYVYRATFTGGAVDWTLSQVGVIVFNTVDGADTPGWAISGSTPVSGGSIGWYAWGGGQSATRESFVGVAMVQSPLPGNPLIVRSSNCSLLMPIEPTDANPHPLGQNGTKMLQNIGLGQCQALGFLTIGGREPRCYWWETNRGGPAITGTYRSRIASLDAYGADYQVHPLTIDRILGVTPLKERGAMGLTSGDRVIIWTGRAGGDDTGLFYDEDTAPGYVPWCVSVSNDDGQLYATVNHLPYVAGAIAQGSVNAQKRRYDFELKRWHPISAWTTLTENGLIRWTDGVPIPVTNTTTGPVGYMSAYGAPDLPFGPVTRNMHDHCVPGRYSTDLQSLAPLPASGFDHTWDHKFQEPNGSNPRSFQGAQDYAAGGANRYPGFVFDGSLAFEPKYLDYIINHGELVGGSVKVRWAEFGRLDETAPGPLEAVFDEDASHEGRRYPFPHNHSAVMMPQIEVEIIQGSDETLTPQAAPITLGFHIDLQHDDLRPPWLDGARADPA